MFQARYVTECRGLLLCCCLCAGTLGQNPAGSASDPIVQTAVGAAALGLGGVGGLGKSSSEPDADPSTLAGSAVPMNRLSASPVQVGKALKVSH